MNQNSNGENNGILLPAITQIIHISENFAATSATTADIGAGALYYDASTDKKTNVFGGFSVYHLNKPKGPDHCQRKYRTQYHSDEICNPWRHMF